MIDIVEELAQRRFVSKEHRRKISEALKGRHLSEEHRRKISEAIRGSEEHQRKIRGRSLRAAHRRRMRAVNVRSFSEEVCRKMSEGQKKVWQDPEIRNRRVEGLRKYWQDPERQRQREWKRRMREANCDVVDTLTKSFKNIPAA